MAKSKQKRQPKPVFSARCTCGFTVETPDEQERDHALRLHLATHEQRYRAGLIELALQAPDPEGALKFFGISTSDD